MTQPRIFATLLVIPLLVPLATLSGQGGSRLWRPEERVVLSDFGEVEAVAAGDDVVYSVTRGGLAVYDRRFARWEPPVSALDGFPTFRTFAAMVDPTDRSLWLGTERGLVNFQPRMRRFEAVQASGEVTSLMFDRTDVFSGLYFRDRSGWSFLPRGGLVPQAAMRIPPPSRQIRSADVQEVLAEHPLAGVMRSRLLTDALRRTYRYTSAATVPLGDEVYFGTDGLGLLKLDVAVGELEPLPFGLLGPGASAVTATGSGVWVGTDDRASRSGLTYLDSDFQQFEYREASAGPGAFGVHDILEADGRVWAATDAGLLVWDGAGRPARVAGGNGLPADRAFALALDGRDVWVGTDRGLARVARDGTVEEVGARLVQPVPALAVRGDTVWVGSTAGLGATMAGLGRVVVPPDVAAVPELREPIVAIATKGAVLAVATPDRIVWRSFAGEGAGASPDGADWTVERVLSANLGRLVALAADSDAAWVGGERGFARYTFATKEFVFFNSPGDLPGRIAKLAVDVRYVWVATDGGLVRFVRSALAP